MQGSKPLAFRITAVTLFLLLAVFVVLSADVIVRVWLLRRGLGTAVDAAILLACEAARALTTALALGLAVVSFRRAGTAGQRGFTLLLLFLALWYTKAFAFESFPGHLQERMAVWLFGQGVSRRAASLVFGAPAGAAWLALGALLRVSVSFPGPLDAAVIERSGQRDRTGLLRGVGLAGIDVGALSRGVSAALLRRGAFDAAPVWLITAAAGVLHAGTRSQAVQAGLWAGFGVLVILALTNLRAATADAPAGEQRRVLWMLQAAIAGASAFATTAILSVAASGFTVGLSFGLAAVAPPVVLMGMSFGLTRVRPPDPRPAITNTLLAGVTGTAMATAFVITARLAGSLASPPFADVTAALAAVACSLVLWSRIRRFAVRLGSSVAALS